MILCESALVKKVFVDMVIRSYFRSSCKPSTIVYVTRSGKRYNSAQKFKIALRVLFESATHAAYNEENRTFVTASVRAPYAITRAPFRARYFEILRAEIL